MKRILAVEKTLASFATREFEWGSADCMAFICAYLRAAGCHPKGLKHGRWKSERSAVRGLLGLGFTSLEALFDTCFERAPKICARDGDIALVKATGEWGGAIGLVAGRRIHAMGQHGLTVLPLGDALHVWRPECPR